MPDSISLSIPIDLRTPGAYIEIDPSRAVAGLPLQRRRLLLLGQNLSTGMAAVGVPVRITGVQQARVAFGAGSMLARMAAALWAGPGQSVEVWGLPLADATGSVAWSGTIQLSGTAQVAGTLAVYVAGTRVPVGVAAGDLPAAVATALAAAINAHPDLPVTATVVTDTVTVLARNKGLCGNGIDLRDSYYQGEAPPLGLGTHYAGAVTTGSGNPDLGDALAAMAGTQWYSIVCPWSDSANMATLEDELDARWGPLDMRTGHAFLALTGTFSTTTTWGGDRNNPHLSALGLPGTPTWGPELAAAWAGTVEYYAAIDPARPFTTLPLPGVLAPAEAAQLSRAERNLLLWTGISTATVGADGGVAIERVITTYQQTTNGVQTDALLDLTTVWTVDYIRYAVRARILERYPRHKLADDGTRFQPGQAITTPRLIRAELIALAADLEAAGLVEDGGQFARDLLVERSTTDRNRVNAVIPPNIVNQFLVFAAAIQYRL